MLLHPIETAEGIYIAVTNPKTVAQALIEELGNTIDHGSLKDQGRLTGDVLMIFIPGPKFTEHFKKLARSGKLSGKALADVKELADGKARLILAKEGANEFEDLGAAANIDKELTEKVLQEKDGIVRAKIRDRNMQPDFPVDEFGGTASKADSTINKYQKNTRAVVGGLRTVESMLDYAKARGLDIPDWVNAYEVPSTTYMYGHSPKRKQITMMQYARRLPLDPDSTIYWNNPNFPQNSIAKSIGDRVPIEIKEGLLKNDEAFLHYLAHELHELKLLKQAFDNAGGALNAKTVAELVDPLRGGTYHKQAWEEADRFIRELREQGE